MAKTGAATLHIIYRTCAVENSSPRPEYYSKALCAASLRLAISEATISCDLIVIQDGPEQSEALPVLKPVTGKTITTAGLGNAASLQVAFRFVNSRTDWSDEDLVYFVEDDYLHTPSAISRLGDAWHLPKSVCYLTLYEHPNAYARGGPNVKELIHLGPGGHWRTITSTCMTFAARLSCFRRDFRLHMMAADNDGKPLDYALWLAIQGAWPERALLRYYRSVPTVLSLRGRSLRVAKAHMIMRRTPRTTQLVAPLPSEATHLDLSAGLARGVDWEQVAMLVR